MTEAEANRARSTLRRIGLAAMSGLSDAEIERDPVAAMERAQGAMRGYIESINPRASLLRGEAHD